MMAALARRRNVWRTSLPRHDASWHSIFILMQFGRSRFSREPGGGLGAVRIARAIFSVSTRTSDRGRRRTQTRSQFLRRSEVLSCRLACRGNMPARGHESRALVRPASGAFSIFSLSIMGRGLWREDSARAAVKIDASGRAVSLPAKPPLPCGAPTRDGTSGS